MKTKISLLIFLLFTSVIGFCTTWQITNNGFSFSPSSITIALGDSVNFSLDPEHNVVEVSQATWNTDGNSPLSGGFQTAFGGGLVSSTKLTAGTHYYVCDPHASLGMKGMITVSSLSLPENQLKMTIVLFPNPTTDLITIKSTENILGSTYSVVDGLGKTVLAGKLDTASVTVDTSPLAAGLYFFRIGNETSQTFKILKE